MIKRGIFLMVAALVLLFTAAIILGGCAHGRARKNKVANKLLFASRKNLPGWITRIPEEKKYYYFVGSSSDASTMEKGKREAVNDALKQVVETIGVKVSAESTQEERYYAEEYKLEVSTRLLQKGEAKLQGAELKELYYEKYERADGSIFYRVWTLVRYSKQEISKEQKRIQAILELRYGEVKRYEDEALKLEKKYNYYHAIQYRIDAALAAQKLEGEGVLFDRNINKASILLTKISLEKFGVDQIGWVGKPLEKPLIVYVYIKEGDKEYPQKGVPVKFLYKVPRSYTAGYKYIVYNGETDNNGDANLLLDRVYEVNNHNVVEAKIDFSNYLKSLSSVSDKYKDRIAQFKSLANSKKIKFVFKSDTKARNIKTSIYIIQIDKDDKLLPKPAVAPVIYDVLYKKYFNVKLLDIPPSRLLGKNNDVIWDELVKASGKSAHRIAFGYVRILNYEELSGFYVAQAEVSVNLYDKENGDIINSWKIDRSGTGSTKKEAQLSVFTEVGKSLGQIASRMMP